MVFNIGIAHYFNRNYNDYTPIKVPKNKIEKSSDMLFTIGLGYFPDNSDDFGEPYNVTMITSILAYRFTNNLSLGLLAHINFDKAKSVGTRVFPEIGPIVHFGFFNKRIITMNTYTGLLFSNYYIPSNGLPYASNLVYLPLGLGISMKVNKWMKGLYLDLNMSQNFALFGERKMEGNNSTTAIGIRYDFLNK